jgi:tetratricopeptide (TPR) repeat protein
MRLRLALTLALALSGCALRGPPLPAAPSGAPSGAPATVSPQPPAPGPAERPPGAAPRPTPMGPAAVALLSQAQRQAGAGDLVAAGATLERALRIEPDNPRLWVELGRVQLQQGNAPQAEGMGHKALSLGGADPAAQAAAWTLIADSLRARGRNPEAADADHHAATLMPR